MPEVVVITESVFLKRTYIDEMDRRFINPDEVVEILAHPEKYDGQEFIVRGV